VSLDRIRRRLERQERAGRAASVKHKDRVSPFHIDPAIAKSLRDDHERHSLLHRRSHRLTTAELEEKERLAASIADRAKKIDCPPDYGVVQVRNDSQRLLELESRRSRIGLTDAEDAEEAQLRARCYAYEYSSESKARSRILDLILKSWGGKGLLPAEQAELDRLRETYPDPPPDPNDPLARRA